MKNLIWLSAYLIISAIFSSCSKDDENTSIIPEGEKTNVNVSLNIAPINAMETNINDNRTSIENFWLLEFDTSKRCCSYKRTTIQYQLCRNSRISSRG